MIVMECSVDVDVRGRNLLEARMTGLYTWEKPVIHEGNISTLGILALQNLQSFNTSFMAL